jgi:rhodanese-related sulfurtransferase
MIMVREMDVRAFAAAHRDGAVVVDVRQAHEYVSGHVPGATLMPMGTVRDHLRDLPGGRPVYVICATGRRSLIAASWMISAGIEAWSVAGGTTAWADAGGPLVTGAPGGSGPRR